jgi:hypothetical protein
LLGRGVRTELLRSPVLPGVLSGLGPHAEYRAGLPEICLPSLGWLVGGVLMRPSAYLRTGNVITLGSLVKQKTGLSRREQRRELALERGLERDLIELTRSKLRRRG